MFGWFRRAKRDDPLKGVAREAFERARETAHRLIGQERTALEARCFDFALSDNTMLSLEAQYLFGVFLELAEDYDLPAGLVDRAELHLTDHLVSTRDMDPEMARAYAHGIEDLYRDDDASCRALVEHGRNAYRSGEIGRLGEIVKALHDSGLDSAAYRTGSPVSPGHESSKPARS